MIENGSDVHQGGDGPLMRAALVGGRIPMMELLVSLGADVNAMWDGCFPIIFAPCEGVEPAPLKWLLDHGANPNAANREGMSALDYVIGSYVRSADLVTCIDLLMAAGGSDEIRQTRCAGAALRPVGPVGGTHRRGSGTHQRSIRRARLRHDRRTNAHAQGRDAPARGRRISKPRRHQPLVEPWSRCQRTRLDR